MYFRASLACRSWGLWRCISRSILLFCSEGCHCRTGIQLYMSILCTHPRIPNGSTPFLKRKHLRQPQRFFQIHVVHPWKPTSTPPPITPKILPQAAYLHRNHIYCLQLLFIQCITACNTSVATIMGLSIVSASFLIQQAYHNQPGSNCFNVPTSGTTLTVPQGGHSTPLSSGG